MLESMLEVSTIIADSLSPAVAISGIGLLIFGLNNRIIHIGSRVRELNRELRQSPPAARRQAVQKQVEMFMRRARLVRNAIFLLFASLAMMVFTAVAIALVRLDIFDWQMVPTLSFMGGLVLILVAAIIEAFETTANLTTLKLDVSHSLESTQAESQSAG